MNIICVLFLILFINLFIPVECFNVDNIRFISRKTCNVIQRSTKDEKMIKKRNFNAIIDLIIYK